MSTYKDINTEKPPLFEDALLVTSDGERVLGYYAGQRHGKDEFCTSVDDEYVNDVVGWLPVM